MKKTLFFVSIFSFLFLNITKSSVFKYNFINSIKRSQSTLTKEISKEIKPLISQKSLRIIPNKKHLSLQEKINNIILGPTPSINFIEVNNNPNSLFQLTPCIFSEAKRINLSSYDTYSLFNDKILVLEIEYNHLSLNNLLNIMECLKTNKEKHIFIIEKKNLKNYIKENIYLNPISKEEMKRYSSIIAFFNNEIALKSGPIDNFFQVLFKNYTLVTDIEKTTENPLTLIVGPMFANKTTQLIEEYNENKENTLCFKHKSDKRYNEDKISSHNKKSINSFVVETTKEFINIINSKENINKKIILIDEIQFFDISFIPILLKLKKNGYRITCSGLNQFADSQMPFLNTVPILQTLADNVIHKTGKCFNDPKHFKATHTTKLGGNKNLSVEIGGNDMYESVCKECAMKNFNQKEFNKNFSNYYKNLEKLLEENTNIIDSI